MTTPYAVTLEDVRDAAERIGELVHRTPIMTCNALDRMAERSLIFKCENFQRVGAFKFRGACSAITMLSDETAARGVVTHSSGNHAQALALAAAMRGITAHIVMPSTANPIKRAATEEYGGRVVTCEPTQHARERTAEQIVRETGATLIPPYDHPQIMAGQGTAALELIEHVPNLNAVITPVGGGGLLAGTCITIRGLAPRVRIFAAEPLAADDAARSMELGERQPAVDHPDTIADGLLTSLGELTWPIIRDHVERVITVSDAQIVEAMRLIWQRMKIIVEPSAATALAAVLSDAFRRLDGCRRVGIILSGGNVDLDHLPW